MNIEQKQEEIREIYAKNLLNQAARGLGLEPYDKREWGKMSADEKAPYYYATDEDFRLLSSQGVVIAVDEELPPIPYCAFETYAYEEVQNKCHVTQNKMLEVGYHKTYPLVSKEAPNEA